MDAFLNLIVAGILSSNLIVTSGAGVELSSNNLNSIKNGFFYGVIVLLTSIISTLFIYLAELILTNLELQGFVILVGILIIAIIVQLTEYVLKKFFPLFFTQTRYIVPSLVCSLILLIFGSLNGENLGGIILDIVVKCVGIISVLVIIAGIRETSSKEKIPSVFRGNLLTLIILFVLALMWTAFI